MVPGSFQDVVAARHTKMISEAVDLCTSHGGRWPMTRRQPKFDQADSNLPVEIPLSRHRIGSTIRPGPHAARLECYYQPN